MNNNLLQQLDDWVSENYPDQEILIANGFEEAFMGVAVQFDNHIPIFSKSKCLDILISQGMSYDEAVEFFDFNVQNAWHGSNTPAFIDIFNPENA
jgi:hypothetical protein